MLPDVDISIFALVDVVNFTLTTANMNEKILSFLVETEHADLHLAKYQMKSELVELLSRLRKYEDILLERLTSTATSTSLINDDVASEMMLAARAEADSVALQVKQLQSSFEKMVDYRENLKDPSKQLTSICRAVFDMELINQCYTFGLETYMKLLSSTVGQGTNEKFSNASERLRALVNKMSWLSFSHYSQALQRRDLFIFSFLTALYLAGESNKLGAAEQSMLLSKNTPHIPNSSRLSAISEIGWLSLTAKTRLSQLDECSSFAGLLRSISQEELDWNTWRQTPEPENHALPGEWENQLNDLQKLLLVRFIRPDRINASMRRYVIANMGKKFTESVSFQIQKLYESSVFRTPIIVFLSGEVDPIVDISELAAKCGMENRLNVASLGVHQIHRANRLIAEGMRTGDWVVIANCHLAKNWSRELGRWTQKLQSVECQSSFRLWLTARISSDVFTSDTLRQSCKAVAETGSGYKATITKYIDLIKAGADRNSKRLTFSVICMHAFIVGRQKFKRFGWLEEYQFYEADILYTNSVALTMFADQKDSWKELQDFILDITYGSRISKEGDRKLLRTVASTFFNAGLFEDGKFKFLSNAAEYYIPDTFTDKELSEAITYLPATDSPEAFAMHANASILSDIHDGAKSIRDLATLTHFKQDIKTSDELLLSIIERFVDQIGVERMHENAVATKPTDYVLLDDLNHYYDILHIAQGAFRKCFTALKGLSARDQEVIDLCESLSQNMVPPKWLRNMPSEKPFDLWIQEIVGRIKTIHSMMDNLENKTSKSVRLGVLRNPVGYLMAALEMAAQVKNLPLESIHWETQLIKDESKFLLEPGDFVAHDLYLEGASYDTDSDAMKEANFLQNSTKLPMLLFKTSESRPKIRKGSFKCPVYQTSKQVDLHDTNFVCSIVLDPGSENAAHWILRGASAYCG